ncbi:MAG TPA: DUF4956 domain-containing protein [Gemmatimonadales bacterium]|nr:DUF4956 domain-containing protein [Gemmatimonadales bacterium]
MTPPRTSPLARLLVYYGLIALAVWAMVSLFPGILDLLERFRQLSALSAGSRGVDASRGTGFESMTQGDLAWITFLSMLEALALVLPVAYVYMVTKQRRGYDQSVVQTVMVLPMVVAGTLILVQNSLSLAFALGAVLAAVRFRNTLKDTKDAVYIFLALAVGVAAGLFSPAVAAVSSIVFNLTVLALWYFNIGNIYVDQRGRVAPLRPGEALLGPAKTGDFMAVGDPRLLAALTPDQLDEVADRAARLQAYIVARTGDEKKKRFTAVVLVHARDSQPAQQAVEPFLEDRTKRWRLAEILPEEGGTVTLEYLVRLKDDVEAGTFLDDLQRAGAPSVVAAEYRSLRGLKRGQE